MPEKYPRFPVWCFTFAAVVSVIAITHYIATGGPHMIHYLKCNFYIPGLQYLYFSSQTLYYSLSDAIDSSPLDDQIRQSTAKIPECEGCKSIRDFTPDDAPEIFAWMKTFTCRKIKHEPYNHICLRPYSGDQMSFAWTQFGYYELHYRTALEQLFKIYPNAGLIDVGTNIGSHALLAAAMGVQVLAFDANPFNLKILHKSIEVNQFTSDQIRIFWNAISDRNGNVSIKWKNGHNLEGNSRICDEDSCNEEVRHDTSGKVFDVPAITLSDISSFIAKSNSQQKSTHQQKKPWILKIDIEGQESAAIMKSDLLLGTDPLNFVPVMLMEYRVAYLASRKRAREMVRLFYEFGYCAYGYIPFMMTYYRIENTYYEDWPHDIILIKQSNLCNKQTLESAKERILGAVPLEEHAISDWDS